MWFWKRVLASYFLFPIFRISKNALREARCKQWEPLLSTFDVCGDDEEDATQEEGHGLMVLSHIEMDYEYTRAFHVFEFINGARQFRFTAKYE